MKTALILIDIQKGFREPFWGKRNNPQLEQNVARLLKVWREAKRPIFHVQHLSKMKGSPLGPKSPGVQFMEEAQPFPGEPIFQKHVNSAFIGTDLEKHLRDLEINTLAFVGLTTDHCVSTSVRMAGNLGFKCFLVSDATATFDRTGPNGKHYSADEVHRIHLASLHEEFATVTTTAGVLKHLE